MNGTLNPTTKVARSRARTGDPDFDAFHAVCTACGWQGAWYSNLTGQGRDLAARAAEEHRCSSDHDVSIAAPTPEVAYRPDVAQHPAHPHALRSLVGYVVRRTLPYNPREQSSPIRQGRDLAVVWGARGYGQALEIARAHRGEGEYAVVDHMFACGCRTS